MKFWADKMTTMIVRLLILVTLSLLLSNGGLADNNDLLKKRKLFGQLYSAALKGQHAFVNQKRHQLHGYVLEHYLDYATIHHNLNKNPGTSTDQIIADFKVKHPNSPLNRRLDTARLNALGIRAMWPEYLKWHNGLDSGKKQCWYLQARLAMNQTQNLPALVEAMWMSGLSAPDACDPVFKWWQQQGYMKENLILKRIKKAFEHNNFSLITYLKSKLKKEPSWVGRAIELAKRPEHGLRQSITWTSDAETVWLIEKTAMRMASEQPMTLQAMWSDINHTHVLTATQKQLIERKMALFAATDYNHWSIGAMEQLPEEMKDDQIKAWIVRYYLFNQSWPDVLKALQNMSPNQLARDNWQYWLARAHVKTGQPTKAKAIFTKLATKTNYYSFLSADHLRLPYALCQKNPVNPNPQFQASEGIERAIELHHLGMLSMARSEWNVAYKGISRPDKQALSERVMKEGWYAKAIAIMADMGQWDNYHLRYPIAHKKTIAQYTKGSSILPQWVMAIIKQESAWTKDAVSHANAHGLMQLLPSTAQRLSDQLGINYKDQHQLHQPDFNIKLGISYQKKLFEQFNHPILAAAAYNAGEGKSIDWSVDFPTSPDIWLETIPYKETRKYVTKILSNVTIYDWLINGQPKRISHWMPTMPVNKQTSQPWPAASVVKNSASLAVCSP